MLSALRAEPLPQLVRADSVNARQKDGFTSLMDAALNNPSPKVIITLLKAGADGKAKSNEGNTAFDYAQINPKLKGTDAYWKLHEALY